MKEPPNHRGRGRFHLLDIVQWCAGRGKKTHMGTIVQVVPYGTYPRCCHNEKEILKTRHIKKEDVEWMNLLKCGFMRDYESYVVENGSGKRWWPRVGNLQLISSNNEGEKR